AGTGGRQMGPPCWWRGWTKHRTPGGTSPTRRTPHAGRPRWPTRRPGRRTRTYHWSMSGSTAERRRSRGTGPRSRTWPRCAAATHSADRARRRPLPAHPATGSVAVVREDPDEHWLDIVPGVPGRTPAGRIVWTTAAEGSRRLLVAPAADLGDRTAKPVTPAGLHVREVLAVDGDTVLFTASEDPTETGLWLHGPGGLSRLTPDVGVHTRHRA